MTLRCEEGGAFLQFLGTIFEALGEAKPAGQAKLLEKRAAKRPKSFHYTARPRRGHPSRSNAEARQLLIQSNQEFLPARRVWERYGVTQMTLWRWLRDEEMGFPRPVYLGRFRYFRVAELERWEASQRRGKDAAA